MILIVGFSLISNYDQLLVKLSIGNH